MYSHDTFGLGHLRRCRTIAHALVDQFKGVHVLIISGSQIAGAFEFKARVDFVKIPSVIKLYNGEYTSISRHIDIQETLEWRKAIIQSTAASFDPDLLIVDKEPLGLRGELIPTLEMLKSRGCRLVVGLRDVMDGADELRAEWSGRDVLGQMARYFDDVWVYGPAGFHNPLAGLNIPHSMKRRLSYTGFLRREMPTQRLNDIEDLPQDYVLVTAGGGGDGAPMMRAVIAAHRLLGPDRRPLLVVLGPFMSTDDREDIRRAAQGLADIRIIDFHARHELLLQGAAAVVSMAGYNTFCEILSLNKRTLLIPRTSPRQEQRIRAERAAALGLADVMLPDDMHDAPELARRLQALTSLRPPLEAGAGEMMGGLERICELVRDFFPPDSRRDVFLPPAAE
jgi:predicted glycosyltransferase